MRLPKLCRTQWSTNLQLGGQLLGEAPQQVGPLQAVLGGGVHAGGRRHQRQPGTAQQRPRPPAGGQLLQCVRCRVSPVPADFIDRRTANPPSSANACPQAASSCEDRLSMRQRASRAVCNRARQT